MTNKNAYSKQILYQLLTVIVKRQKDAINGSGGGSGKKKKFSMLNDSDEEDEEGEKEDLARDTLNLITGSVAEDLLSFYEKVLS